ncbi:lectin like domain-containing protein [Methanoregula sp.]|uniref:lectin like domain-containing protein n=1 Tax=Methanoregula sp. TaxID=2052170 RepID=UPI0035666797
MASESITATPTALTLVETTSSFTITQNDTPVQISTSASSRDASAIGSDQITGKALSGGLFVAPENPEFAEYLNRSKLKSTTRTMASVVLNNGSTHVFVEGSIPSPVSLAYTAGQHIGPDNGIQSNRGTYPASYDLKALGKVTSVKDQGKAGACWAFASVASLESSFLTNESWDFSENNLKNTLASTYTDGFDRNWDGGGNSYMSAAYFTRWSGPVRESDDPYNDVSGISPGGLSPVKHVQNVYFLPERASSTDNDNIKYALTTWGAVAAGIYWDDSYYNPSTTAFYNSGTAATNHLITLVGWDDTYSRTNFVTQPPGDGAFIVKNSWGTAFGDEGYFYISYYDLTVGNYCAAFTGESTSDYNQEYSYDPLGRVDSVGYSKTSAYYANVFTSNSTETLKAVEFFTPTTNTAYTVSIYLDPNSGPVNTSGYAAQTSGTLSSPGYRTVTVPAVALSSGQKFSIVVLVTTPGYNWPIPVEYPLEGYSSHATASAGQSYISPDGSTWTDMTSAVTNANVCVKGYTTTLADHSVATIGVFRPSTGIWYLDYNFDGTVDKQVKFGKNGDTAVAGDWNGAGNSEIGVFRSSTGYWYLDYNFDGTVDKTAKFGKSGDLAVAGDWNGAGNSEIGVFRSSTGYWYLDYNFDGTVDKTVKFGKSGDPAVAGDWNGAGNSEIGVFRPSTGYWYLDYNFDGTVDKTVKFGKSGDLAVAGDWNGAGNSEIGVFRPSTGTWYLDYNFDGTVDKTVKFGKSGDSPVAGHWA